MDFHTLVVRAVRPEGSDALVLEFDLPADLRAAFAFEPGQHLTLRRRAGAEELRRSYSICAMPGEALRVGVRRVPGGVFSNWVHDALRPGSTVEVAPPQGRFGAALQRPAAAGRHVLGVAAGSGITPILAIVKTVLENEPASRVTLVYGNRTPASSMFLGELLALKNRHLARLALHPVFSRERQDTLAAGGRLDGPALQPWLRLAGPVDEAFVCGPHGFNDTIEAALLAHGLAREQVHVERFGVPTDLPAAATPAAPAAVGADGPAFAVTLVRDGVARDLPWQPGDGSVLAAARRAGMDLPYSCQSGVCATCRAKVLQGQVEMARNFALEPAEVAAGWVLTCQARPRGPVVLSFDAR